MEFFSVRSWTRYQHYSKRNPPWIKLYTSLLDDFEFMQLPEASRLLAVNILMLAAKTDNRMPKCADWLKVRFSLSEADLEPLYGYGLIEDHDASKAMLAQGDRKSRAEIKTDGQKAASPRDFGDLRSVLKGVPR